MTSKFLKLNASDWVKGLVIAVLVVVFGAVQQSLTVHGLDVLNYDWASILDLAAKAAGAYLLKNFLSTSDGKVLGRIG